jgi:hypothetical protein
MREDVLQDELDKVGTLSILQVSVAAQTDVHTMQTDFDRRSVSSHP